MKEYDFLMKDINKDCIAYKEFDRCYTQYFEEIKSYFKESKDILEVNKHIPNFSLLEIENQEQKDNRLIMKVNFYQNKWDSYSDGRGVTSSFVIHYEDDELIKFEYDMGNTRIYLYEEDLKLLEEKEEY